MINSSLMCPDQNWIESCVYSPASCSTQDGEWRDTRQGKTSNEYGVLDLFEEESFLQDKPVVQMVVNPELFRKCYSGGFNDASWFDSSHFQEDISLSQDDDGSLKYPSSDDTDEEDDMMHDAFFGSQDSLNPELGLSSEKYDQSSNFNSIDQFESKSDLRQSKPPITPAEPAGTSSDTESDGIRLVHLLLAAADASASHNMDLVEVILGRLSELTCYSGNTMERVAAYFCDALQCHMEGSRANQWASKTSAISRDQFLAAFQIIHEFAPFLKFAHFTANEAILEAIEGESRIHIVDYEIMEGVQWASLMHSLVSRKRGAPHLRITALSRPCSKRGVASVLEIGRRLSEFAASLNLPFSFAQVRLDRKEKFRPSALKILKGEALVVNCMLNLPHMPHRTANSVASFLSGMQKLAPAIVTLVEEELGYCGTDAFTSNFFQIFHHYSSMFDSLHATLSSNPLAQLHVERTFLAPRIMSALQVSLDPAHSAEQKSALPGRKWFVFMSSAGFDGFALSTQNLCQARLLLGLFEEGFQVASADGEPNCLRLGWHSNPLFAVSVWKSG